MKLDLQSSLNRFLMSQDIENGTKFMILPITGPEKQHFLNNKNSEESSLISTILLQLVWKDTDYITKQSAPENCNN